MIILPAVAIGPYMGCETPGYAVVQHRQFSPCKEEMLLVLATSSSENCATNADGKAAKGWAAPSRWWIGGTHGYTQTDAAAFT